MTRIKMSDEIGRRLLTGTMPDMYLEVNSIEISRRTNSIRFYKDDLLISIIDTVDLELDESVTVTDLRIMIPFRVEEG